MKAADGFAACNVLRYGEAVCIASGEVCEKAQHQGETAGLTTATISKRIEISSVFWR